MRISFIGSGNTASVLGRLMKTAGHSIAGVYSKTVEHAQHLAVELNAQQFGTAGDAGEDGSLYIVAVSDGAIATLASTLKLPNSIIVHTSGSVPGNTLQRISGNYGVLYPLQSLRKQATHQPIIPLLIDGSSQQVLQQLQQLARSISPVVEEADDEKRLKLHLAAVMASNFANHMYVLAENFCINEGINFNTLVPLIQEVAARTAIYSPASMQTGPAIRGDMGTIQRHIELLEKYPAQQKIYLAITDSIMEFYNNK